MVIQIYIIHVLCYGTVKHCECVKIVQNTHFQLYIRLLYSISIVARPLRMLTISCKSESQLTVLNRFLCSSTTWSSYCFCSSFFVVLLNVCTWCNVDGPTAHWSDEYDPLVQKPISLMAHWSENP